MCLLCSVLGNIKQLKNVMNNLKYLKILFLLYKFDLNFFMHFLSILDHFQAIKKNGKILLDIGVPDLSGKTIKKKTLFYVCLPWHNGWH